jgi:hypothetical protein
MTCAIVANANRKNQPTVNIVTTKTASVKSHAQVTAASAGHTVPTYQASGGTIAGLKTIHIAGYSGPT